MSRINRLVPEARIELARLFRARDFKSLVSTDFTIRARTSNKVVLNKSRQAKF